MTFSKYRESTKPLFKQLRILDIFKLNTLLLVSLCTHKEKKALTKPFHNYFSQNKDQHHYNTRSATKKATRGLLQNKLREILPKSHRYQIWNDLPVKVKNNTLRAEPLLSFLLYLSVQSICTVRRGSAGRVSKELTLILLLACTVTQ